MEPRELIKKNGRDIVTGLEGTITGYWISMTGSDRVLLESMDTTGRPVEQWVDVERLELI